jgi:hypothetical protein
MTNVFQLIVHFSCPHCNTVYAASQEEQTGDWERLKSELTARRVRVVALDLPTSWSMATNSADEFTGRMFEAMLADKAARTVMMLTERLDHQRGRGQQQITVKHVTTNNVTADQAIIAESVTTGAGRNTATPALLAASPEMPMPILDEITPPDPAGMGGGTKSK